MQEWDLVFGHTEEDRQTEEEDVQTEVEIVIKMFLIMSIMIQGQKFGLF